MHALLGIPLISREWVDKLVRELLIVAARQEAREADPEYWKRREEIKARRAEQIRNDWINVRYDMRRKKREREQLEREKKEEENDKD